jgi:NitT/TauT family transport system ATP-binding protein
MMPFSAKDASIEEKQTVYTGKKERDSARGQLTALSFRAGIGNTPMASVTGAKIIFPRTTVKPDVTEPSRTGPYAATGVFCRNPTGKRTYMPMFAELLLSIFSFPEYLTGNGRCCGIVPPLPEIRRSVVIMATIGLENISMLYGSNGSVYTALSGVNLDIHEGDFISLIGPSGCGKSTIIDLVSGLKTPTGGTVRIDNEPVSGPGPDRGTVFQDYSLFPWMTTFENVCFAIEHTHGTHTRTAVEDSARKYLDLVGLGKFKNAYPNTLSGGMRQRVSIARMFSMNPRVFLMDEPFGALDSLNRIYMQDLLLHLWSEGELRKTVLFVTHDVDEALLLSDRIAVMSPSPGKIKEIIDVPFARPRCRKSLSASTDYIALKAHLLSVLYCEMLDMMENPGTDQRSIA